MPATVSGFIDLVQQAYEGKLKLPAFQRDWKWKRNQVILLFDSLRQGFPIGSFLFLKKSKDVDLSPRDFIGASPEAAKADPERLVLDGQQRLTAGLELFYGDKGTRYFLDLNGLNALVVEKAVKLDNSGSVAAFVADLDVTEHRYCVPRSITGDPSSILTSRHLLCTTLLVDDAELQRALRLYKKQFPEREDFIDFVIQPHFRPSQRTQVPITEIEDVIPVEGISRIFATLNTTGKLLTPFELVVATLYPKKIRLNDDLAEAKEAFPYYKNIDEFGDIFLQTIALLAGRDTKKASLPKTITEDIYRQHQDDAFLYLNEAGKLMTEHIGLGLDASSELLVYPVIFPPLAYVLLQLSKTKHSPADRSRINQKLVRWFIGAVLTRRYQQSTHDRQLRDRLEIPKWLAGPEDEDSPQWLRDAYIPNLKPSKPEGAVGKLLRCLMNKSDLRDPLTNSKIGVKSGVAVTAKHHIFPTRFVPNLKGWNKESTADVALNIMYLEQQTNVSWLNSDPQQQLSNAFQTLGEQNVRLCLEDHALPDSCVEVLLRSDKTRDDFSEFIERRERAFVTTLERWGFRKPAQPAVDEDVDDE